MPVFWALWLGFQFIVGGLRLLVVSVVLLAVAWVLGRVVGRYAKPPGA